MVKEEQLPTNEEQLKEIGVRKIRVWNRILYVLGYGWNNKKPDKPVWRLIEEGVPDEIIRLPYPLSIYYPDKNLEILKDYGGKYPSAEKQRQFRKTHGFI